jgi:hypothetical protein
MMMRASADKLRDVEASRKSYFENVHALSANKGLIDPVDFSTLRSVQAKGVDVQSSSSTGYVYQYLSYGEVCASQPFAAIGLTIDQCLVDDNGNSFIYTCNESESMYILVVHPKKCDNHRSFCFFYQTLQQRPSSREVRIALVTVEPPRCHWGAQQNSTMMITLIRSMCLYLSVVQQTMQIFNYRVVGNMGLRRK